MQLHYSQGIVTMHANKNHRITLVMNSSFLVSPKIVAIAIWSPLHPGCRISRPSYEKATGQPWQSEESPLPRLHSGHLSPSSLVTLTAHDQAEDQVCLKTVTNDYRLRLIKSSQFGFANFASGVPRPHPGPDIETRNRAQ